VLPELELPLAERAGSGAGADLDDRSDRDVQGELLRAPRQPAGELLAILDQLSKLALCRAPLGALAAFLGHDLGRLQSLGVW
jgi:hypothetical protein